MELNKIKKVSGTVARIRFAIGAIIVGLFFGIVGGILTYKNVSNPATYESTEATITEVNGISSIDDNTFDVMLSYYVNGEEYITSFTASSNEVGDNLTIYYDVENPNNIYSSKNGAVIFPIVFTVIGVAAVGFGIFSLVRGIKERKVDDLDQVDLSNVSEEQIEEIKNSDEPSKEYYFHFCGKLNQSYILETPDRIPVVAINCEKMGVFSKSKFVFTNKLTYASTRYEVTHTVTTSYGGNDISIPYKSSFKMNGVDVFKLIAKKGYSIISKIEGLKLNFDILHYGVPVATLRAAGANVAKDGNSKLGNIPTPGVYKVNARASDLDAVALIAFAVSRVEFF